MNKEDDAVAIAGVTSRLLAAVNAGDVAGVLAVWADDGRLMPPNHSSVQGRGALREYFSQLFARNQFEFVFPSTEVRVFGDVAFEHVTYVAERRQIESQTHVSSRGKGLHVYRRDSDGVWQLICDIWNTDEPPVAGKNADRSASD